MDVLDALKLFHNFLNGQCWTAVRWNTSNPHYCLWDGIRCDLDGSVVGITLMSTNVSGTLPSSSNFWKSFPKLEVLALCHNPVHGLIPESIHWASNLRGLWFTSCNFSGSLPASLGTLSKLQSLHLESNTNLRGALPPEIGNLTALRVLECENTGFRGAIPSSFSKLQNLKELYLTNTALLGDLRNTPIEKLKNLEILDLSRNLFSGQIPALWGSNLRNLRTLDLSHNLITGSLPHSISNMAALEFIDMSSNDLSGDEDQLDVMTIIDPLVEKEVKCIVFDEPSDCNMLRTLRFSNCSLVGNLSDSLMLLTKTETIDISLNQLSGTLPYSVSGQIVHFDEAINGYHNFVVALPPSWSLFSVAGSKIRGALPDSWAKLYQQQPGMVLDFRDTNLAVQGGRAPDFLRGCSHLGDCSDELQQFDIIGKDFPLSCPIFRMTKDGVTMRNVDIRLPMPLYLAPEYKGCQCVTGSFGTPMNCWPCSVHPQPGLVCTQTMNRIAYGFWIAPFWSHPSADDEVPALVRCLHGYCCQDIAGCRIGSLSTAFAGDNNAEKTGLNQRQGNLCAEHRESNARLCAACAAGYSATFASTACVRCRRNEQQMYIAAVGIASFLFVIFLLYTPIQPTTRGPLLSITYFLQTVSVLVIHPDSGGTQVATMILSLFNLNSLGLMEGKCVVDGLTDFGKLVINFWSPWCYIAGFACIYFGVWASNAVSRYHQGSEGSDGAPEVAATGFEDTQSVDSSSSSAPLLPSNVVVAPADLNDVDGRDGHKDGDSISRHHRRRFFASDDTLRLLANQTESIAAGTSDAPKGHSNAASGSDNWQRRATKWSTCFVLLSIMCYNSSVRATLLLLDCIPIGGNKFLFSAAEQVQCFAGSSYWWQYLVAIYLVGFLIPFPFLLERYRMSLSCKSGHTREEKAFLFLMQGPFKPIYPYWQSVMMTRRVFFVIADTFLRRYPPTRWLVLNLLCIGSLAIHIYCQPFMKVLHGMLELTALVALCFICQTSTAFHLAQEEYSKSAFRQIEAISLLIMVLLCGIYLCNLILRTHTRIPVCPGLCTKRASPSTPRERRNSEDQQATNI